LINLDLPAGRGAIEEIRRTAYLMCFFASLALSATSFAF